jgi:predicted nucleotidyltransferase
MKDRNVDVIKYLIENGAKDVNILGMAKAIKMNYKNAFNIVKRLEKEKLVILKKFGASNKIELNKTVHPIIFEAEYMRRKGLLRNKNILVMLDNIKKDMGSMLYVLILFGSYVKKTQTEKSDIDIMFIVPDGTDEKFERKIHQIIKLIPLPIHHMAFSESQFFDMINAKEFNVGKEAMKNNIILFGIENYYEMLQ